MLLSERLKKEADFTALEKQISQYILDHPKEVFNLPLAELASKLYVSKATIIRYYKKLGFDSYRDMCV